ncbi:hypothetical protein [Actinoplanes sp. NPDC023714]|uniref:hypothetical protein n=1 Tax=Actinoplanes sp. NPDC023714 TaxID=3154322 RepID=UPI0033C73F05
MSTAMLQQALIDLNAGFRYFFASLAGRRYKPPEFPVGQGPAAADPVRQERQVPVVRRASGRGTLAEV